MKKVLLGLGLLIGLSVNAQRITTKKFNQHMENIKNNGWVEKDRKVKVSSILSINTLFLERMWESDLVGSNFTIKIKLNQRKLISYANAGDGEYFFEDYGEGPKRLVPETLNGLNLETDVDFYDVKGLINIFIEESKIISEFASKQTGFNLDILMNVKLDSITYKYVDLPGETIALANGMNNDDKIELLIDAAKWSQANDAKKLYIIYHELGHDIFNLSHESGVKMMFPLAKDKYSWDDWFNDRLKMFEKIVQG